MEAETIIRAVALLGAGISMGFGAIGPGIGEGFAAGKACEGISRRPEESGLLTRTMLIGQAVSESTGIYALVIAFILIFIFGR
jgi:F-type H+-transporting ATPase subunit c